MVFIGKSRVLHKRIRKGFTLIEVLLTISIIGVLASIVISSVNPSRFLAQARNAVRHSDVYELLAAITSFTIQNDGITPPDVSLPSILGSTTFSGAHIIDAGFAKPRGVLAFDLDADGDIDIVSGSVNQSGNISYWTHSGAGAPTVLPLTWTKSVIDSYFKPWMIKSGDIDNDGKKDIVAIAKDDSLIAWWRNLGGSPVNFGSSVNIDSAYPSVRALTVANVDGDAHLDVIAGSDKTDSIRWFRNNGSPLTQGWAWKAPALSNKVYVGDIKGIDLDADGDIDIVASYENKLTWWENDGTPWKHNWTSYSIDSTSEQWKEIHVGDIDGDLDLDVAAISLNGRLSYWENDGNPKKNNWAEHVIASNFGGTAITMVDFDLDLDLDVLGASNGGDKIAWWENQGAGSFSGTAVIATGADVNGVSGIATADIDGDGDLDVVAVMEETNTIAWWENLVLEGFSKSAPVANITEQYKIICKFGVDPFACDGNGGVSLEVLIPVYVADLPVDTLAKSDPISTGYEVRFERALNKLYVRSALAELDEEIELAGAVGVSNCLIWDILNNERTCVLFQ